MAETPRNFFSSETDQTAGGSITGGGTEPAFQYVAPRSMPMPVLIAVPHAGRHYPAEILADMRDPDHCTLRLEDRLVDTLGKEIARRTGTGLLIANAPRAMLDLNRARDDVDWDMIANSEREGPRHSQANRRARSGLGLVPRKLSGFGEIWKRRITQVELDTRIDQIHRPYHNFLAHQLEQIRNRWGAALLIDLHSMPPLQPQPGQHRAPEIVIGDRFGASCHASLVARAFRYLDAQACPVTHNRPYSGGYVLERHASLARGLHAVQIEVCRSTYLDNQMVNAGAGLEQLATMLAGLVRELGAEAARIGDRGNFAQAAE